MAVFNWNPGQPPPIVGPPGQHPRGGAYLYGGVSGGGGTSGGVGGSNGQGNPLFRGPQIQNPIAGHPQGTNSPGNSGGLPNGSPPMSTIGNGVTIGQGNQPFGAQSLGASPTTATASITSTYGNPILPYADPNLNQQTTNRLFESSLGQQGLASMLQHLRPANDGMAATVGDQMLINPQITQNSLAGANALTNTPYQQGLGNANALLNWQQGQSGDVLGQFKNLAGLNEAQQNFGLTNTLGNMDYNLGTAGNKVDLLQSLLGGLMGPNSIMGGLTSGLSSGLGNGLSGALGGGLSGLSGLTGLA